MLDRTPATPTQAIDWRTILPPHPACDLFPRVSDAERLKIGESIKATGMVMPVTIFLEPTDPADLNSPTRYSLLDGRERFDALQEVGISFDLISDGAGWKIDAVGYAFPRPVVVTATDTDPYEYCIAVNIHRRHLTNEAKIKLVEDLTKAKPEAPALQIAKLARVSPTTAVKVRRHLEQAGDVSTVETSVDVRGRAQPRVKERKEASSSTDAAPSGATPDSTNTFNANNANASDKPLPAGADDPDEYKPSPIGVDFRADAQELGAFLEALGTDGRFFAALKHAPKLSKQIGRFDPQSFLAAPAEDRAAFVALIGLDVLIEAGFPIKAGKPCEISSGYASTLVKALNFAFGQAELGDDAQAAAALRGIISILKRTGKSFHDLVFTIGKKLVGPKWDAPKAA
jgi:hypothetical protein